MAFRVRVLAFDEGAEIPARYTAEGADVSPTVEWEDAPQGTKSFALIVDDPDAPAGTWTHWMLWDIPAGEHAVSEGFTPGRIGRSGQNDFGSLGYGGPCPPKNHGPHRYQFKLFALDTSHLLVPDGSTRAVFDRALRGHDLAEAHYTGRFERH